MEKPSGSLISFMANKVKTEGGVNLAQGIPAMQPPVELLNILEQTLHDNIHQYAPGKGNIQLLIELEKLYKIPHHQFLIVNGATEAISLLVTYLTNLISNKFSVLAFDPAYESYKHLPRIFKLNYTSFKLTNSGQIDFDLLETVLLKDDVKLILLASPGNPYGKIWNKTEMDTLLEMCFKHKIYIIIDAVYSDLYFNEAPYYPLNQLNEYVFYVNSFSKKFSITGWRIGYLIAHPAHMATIADIHDYVGLCAPSMMQQALGFYLDKYNFGVDYTTDIRTQIKANYIQLSSELNLLGFKIWQVQGGYFIWTELPDKYTDGFEFALNLYEKEKVAIVPGIHFSDSGNRFVRINIARLPYEISMAVSKIKKFIAG